MQRRIRLGRGGCVRVGFCQRSHGPFKGTRCESIARMKQFFKWATALTVIGVGGTIAYRAIQAGRTKVKNALESAEAVAERTRAALEETETALHNARTAI